VMRFGDARLSASTMSRCSMIQVLIRRAAGLRRTRRSRGPTPRTGRRSPRSRTRKADCGGQRRSPRLFGDRPSARFGVRRGPRRSLQSLSRVGSKWCSQRGTTTSRMSFQHVRKMPPLGDAIGGLPTVCLGCCFWNDGPEFRDHPDRFTLRGPRNEVEANQGRPRWTTTR
jgi:hypothetical protein